MFFIQAEDELFGEDWLGYYATNILDAEYEYVDIIDVMDNLSCEFQLLVTVKKVQNQNALLVLD